MKTIILDAAKIRENPSEEWSSLTAMKGESAYEIAVRRGYQGTEAQWVNALETERLAAIASIQNAGAETLADIPSGYTQFQSDVEDVLDNKIVASTTAPSSADTKIWIDTSNTTTTNLPQIDDAHTSDQDTWSSNKINAELGQLSDEIGKNIKSEKWLADGYYKIRPEIIQNSYVKSDGTFANYNGWIRTDYIPIEPDGIWYVFNTVKNQSYNAYYNANKEFIQTFTIHVGSPEAKTVPSNAAYMVLSCEAENFYDTILIGAAVKQPYYNRATIVPYGKDQIRAWTYMESDTRYVYVRIPKDYGIYFERNRSAVYFAQDKILNYTVPSNMSSNQTWRIFYNASTGDLTCYPSFTTSITRVVLTNDMYELFNFAVYDPADESVIVDLPDNYVSNSVLSKRISGESETVQTIIDNNFLRFAELYRQHIPAYWLDDTTNHVLYLSDKIDDIKKIECDTKLAFITDVHWLTNAQHSTTILPYVAGLLDVGAIINGGDILNQEATTALAEYQYRVFSDQMRDAFRSKYRFVFGNHDLNTANWESSYPDTPLADIRLTYNFNYDQSIKPWADELQFESFSTDNAELAAYQRMHYSWDDTENKIRYIVLNTGNSVQPLESLLNDANGMAEIYLQLQYVYDTIMELDDGWSVLLFGHQFFYNLQLQPLTPVKSMARLLNAIQTKSVCTLGYYSEQYAGISTLDCTNAPTVNIIGMICGHDHGDGSAVYSGHDGNATYVEGATDASASGSTLIIKTLCDAYNSTPQTTMTESTTTEQAFDIICIDKANKLLKMVRIGAGSDRTFEY